MQLIKKFVQWCLVRIFRNERSRSTPLDPKLMFWCVSFRLGAFGLFHYCTKPAAKRAKLVQLMQKFRPWCLVRIFCNERSRSTLLDPKLMFWCVFFIRVHFEPFRNYTKLGAKHAKLVQLMQKFMPWCLVRIFTMNAPDPLHWILNSCFGAFLFVWVHLELFCYCTKLAAICA